MSPTPKDFQAPAIVAAVTAYRIALADQKAIEARMWPQYNAVLAAGNFMDDMGHRVLDHKHMYRIEDEAVTASIFAQFDEIRKANGYDLAPGYCPALIAQSKTMEAFKVMVETLEPLIGISYRALICAGESSRTKYVSLVMGVMDKANKKAA